VAGERERERERERGRGGGRAPPVHGRPRSAPSVHPSRSLLRPDPSPARFLCGMFGSLRCMQWVGVVMPFWFLFAFGGSGRAVCRKGGRRWWAGSSPGSSCKLYVHPNLEMWCSWQIGIFMFRNLSEAYESSRLTLVFFNLWICGVGGQVSVFFFSFTIHRVFFFEIWGGAFRLVDLSTFFFAVKSGMRVPNAFKTQKHFIVREEHGA
jgi:hypothetical protein